jgi:methionine-rich copper-binding protein CopC
MVRRADTALACFVVALGLQGGPASAHAALEHANPRVGSKVTASPTEVRMWFSEALEPAFSGASIVVPAGQGAAGAKAFVDVKDRRELVIPLVRPLPAGRYQVKWAVVSVDGHRTEGDFPFTVGSGP